MRISERVTADNPGITRITELVRDTLAGYSVKDKDIEKAVLTAEESAQELAAHSSDAFIEVRIRSFLGRVTVSLTSKGDRISSFGDKKIKSMLDDETDEDVQETIRGILLRSVSDNLSYHHVSGANKIGFTILRSPKAHLYRTLGAMAAAVVVGLILSVPELAGMNDDLNTYVLIPIYTMYLNALKMVVAPVVFFSIVSCIMQFSDMTELGRIGGRAISVFMFTTVVATLVGLGLFYLFRPGAPVTAMIDQSAVSNITSQTVDVSVKDLIVGIVPSDFLQPFVSSNMLQLIFLAVLTGIVIGHMGRRSKMVRDAFESLNELFLKMTTMIIRFMPVAVFCSICSLMIKTGISVVISVLGIFATFLCGLLCMIIVYCMILTIVARVNPILFLKNYIPTMAQVFSVASSNASIPINMEACEKMGVAKKIYCLIIPLGATINMDGGCVYMGVFSLALAKSYGVNVPSSAIVAMIISIIVMSVGAPGIPGSGLICLNVLLTQIGVPTEAVGLIMGIDAFVGMFRCMSNCTGDVVTSVLVAKKENLLDMEKYRTCGGSAK